MAEYTWAELADMAENNPSNLGSIVAALCRHNQGLSGGGGVVTITEKPARKPATKPRAKK
jgi:hypothetical protein